MITLTFFNGLCYDQRINIAKYNDKNLTRTCVIPQNNVTDKTC